ncbi:hypothetical protein THAOC_07296 [Thalassiosira oceanica]|uniref:Uncharacterized protein n=1 Tax=Thalassiosira oceanica TaxID=159749 RepID=K0SXY6_THAOC|nr:hypothetical protein THAOC_07296 [Thalassiosira oceanica]|eukprot:EJK71288.1 hypothetical protein THAOC_07296 [Thalassiosira oceanica]
MTPRSAAGAASGQSIDLSQNAVVAGWSASAPPPDGDRRVASSAASVRPSAILAVNIVLHLSSLSHQSFGIDGAESGSRSRGAVQGGEGRGGERSTSQPSTAAETEATRLHSLPPWRPYWRYIRPLESTQACRSRGRTSRRTLQEVQQDVAQGNDEAAGTGIALAAGMHCIDDQVVHEHSIDTQSRRIHRGGHSACSSRFRKYVHQKTSEARRQEFLGDYRFELHAYRPCLPQEKIVGNITQSHGYGDKSKVQFNVSSAVRDIEDLDSCPYSTVKHHLIVQSAYNDMMGEFYSRTLLGLNQWILDYPIESREQLQMYPHFVKFDRRMLVGHQMFLGGLPNNDIYRSFNDFVRDGRCQCFEKLIFCGYSTERHSQAQLFPKQNLTGDQANRMLDVIKPSGKIDNPKTQCGFATNRESLLNHNCVGYRRLRNSLHKVFNQKAPSLGEMIRATRREILLEKGAISSDNDGVDVFEWKIVGLAKRTVSDAMPTEPVTKIASCSHRCKTRRKWLNIDQVLSRCDEVFMRHRIVCTAVDVEKASRAETQLVMHRSLDAFIGIHGAQLTQGVLLPKRAYIVELLPWVPWYLFGDWVRTKSKPTPLGVIFHNTELQHLGYPLGRKSVPLCLDVDPDDQEAERNCFMNETNGNIEKFRWDERDFNVRAEIVTDFISSFLLVSELSCSEMQARASSQNYVLYNAYCRESTTGKSRYQQKHYYQNGLPPWKDMYTKMKLLQDSENMFPVSYKSGKRLSMGYNSARNERIIRRFNFMDDIFNYIESRGHQIDFIGGQHYQREGKLKNHRDKKRYRFSGSEIALGVEHGTVVILHTNGGGPNAVLAHGGLGDPGCSYIFIVETSISMN